MAKIMGPTYQFCVPTHWHPVHPEGLFYENDLMSKEEEKEMTEWLEETFGEEVKIQKMMYSLKITFDHLNDGMYFKLVWR